MTHYKKHKVRLSVDCTEEERMYIKMLAAKHHMTISEYLLSAARKDMPKCNRSHELNEKTKKVLKESRQEQGEVFDTVSDFWEAMGIKPNVED